jgi:hypothetical protein
VRQHTVDTQKTTLDVFRSLNQTNIRKPPEKYNFRKLTNPNMQYVKQTKNM